MDKVAKLKSVAKGLAVAGAGGILGAGAGISADKQINKNKRNARAKKGWDTRRRNSMTKEAEEKDTVHDVKQAIRVVGNSIDNPTNIAKHYIGRKLITKIRKKIKWSENETNK